MEIDWAAWGPPLVVTVTGLVLGAVLAARMKSSSQEQLAVANAGKQDDLALDKDEVLEALASLEGDKESLPVEEYERQRRELIERGAANLRELDAMEATPTGPSQDALDAAFAEVQAARAAGREPSAEALALVRQAVGAPARAQSASAAQARGFAYAVGLLVLVGLLLGVVSQIDASPRGGGSLTGNGAGGGEMPAAEQQQPPALSPAMEAQRQEMLQRIEADPSDIEALNNLTRLSLAGSDLGAALRYNQLAEGVEPTDKLMRVYKGVLASAIGRKDRAYELIDEVLAEDPELVEGWVYKGLVALSAQDLDIAVTALRRAVALQDPPDPALQAALARAEQLQEMGVGARPMAGGPMAGASAGGGEVLIKGTLELAPEFAGAVPISKATFVYLRVPGRQGPPVASVKLPPGPFPLSFEVTTANILPMAGVAPGDLPDTLEVGARLDQDGNAFSKQDDEPQVTLEAAKGTEDLTLALTAELH